jgi:hypothetical protein
MQFPTDQDEETAGNQLAVSSRACRSCGKPVAWVKTARGRNLPLEPEPSRSAYEGNFGLSSDGVAYFVRDAARIAAFSAGQSEFPIYIAHFATCTAR